MAVLVEPTPAVALTDVTRVAGPLLVVEAAQGVGYGEFVEVVTDDGAVRRGQVLEVADTRAVVQVFGGTDGIGLEGTCVLTQARPAHTGVGRDYLGRVLDGTGRPRDGLPEPVAASWADVNGQAINPVARDHPDQMIETGLSAVDVLLTLVRGQKLPIFSGYGRRPRRWPPGSRPTPASPATRPPGDAHLAPTA